MLAPCILAALVAACGKKADSKASASASAATPTSTPAASATSATTPTATAAASAPPLIPFDAGVNACRLAYGPIQQPWTGAATLVPIEGALEVITNKGGAPTITRMTLPPLAGPRVGKVVLETEPAKVSSSACGVGGPYVFCMDGAGAVTRTLRGELLGKVVAKARPGTRIAAATLGGSHAVVMYLAERKRDDGPLVEAYAAADDLPPVRLSEDGSGATSIALAPRGAGAVALLLDGRAAMTPVHGRTLAWKDGPPAQLDVGTDAVVFVGGGAEPHASCALGTTASGAAFGLVPTPGESGFGMAAVRLGDPPAIDEKTTWSMYPNGLDPAPIAATTGASPIRVARVRPAEARPDAPKGVELGKLDDAGAFTAFGMISTAGRASDLAVATDSAGAMWIYYTDSSGSWLERRVCP